MCKLKMRSSSHPNCTINKDGFGTLSLTLLVIGNTIGTGIFLLPGVLSHYGSIGILSWLVTSIGAVIVALMFAQLSISPTGGIYKRFKETLGNFIAFQVAFNYWSSLWIGNACVVIILINYVKTALPYIRFTQGISLALSLLIIGGVTFVNIRGLKSMILFHKIVFCLLIIPILIVLTAGIPHFHIELLLKDFNISGLKDFNAFSDATALTLWSFIGIEAAVMMSKKSNKQHYVQATTILGTLIVAFLYVASTFIMMGIICPSTLQYSPAPFCDVATKIFGACGKYIVSLCVIASCFSSLTAAILLQGQTALLAAENELFPKCFTILNTHGIPQLGLIISNMLTMILIIIGFLYTDPNKQFVFISLLTSLLVLTVYFVFSIAELKSFFMSNHPETKTIKSFCIDLMALAYITWMIINFEFKYQFYGFVFWLFSGLIYMSIVKKNKSNTI